MTHSNPMYDPPYESPIETAFAWAIVKYLHSSVTFEKQKSLNTLCGEFRPDFVATSRGGYSVAYECDGADFHDISRDEWRDAMLLGDGKLDAIIRLRGCDITYHLDDCLYICSVLDPQFFSERGQRNLSTLASVDARRVSTLDNSIIVITYSNQSTGITNPLLARIIRKERHRRDEGQFFWQTLYNFAKKHGGGKLDDLIEKFRTESLARTRIITS